MTHNPGFLFSILAFVLVIGPLVFVHELGHYAAGRWFGVKAEAFSIGFGREIAGWTDRRGTRWKLGWLPLGGYVRFAGDMNPASTPTAEWLALPAAERARTFQAKPVWQRAIIVAAGPVTNFIAAILILGAFAYAYGDMNAAAVAGPITPASAAASAGIHEGDRIVAFDGQPVSTFNDMVAYVEPRPGQAIAVTFVHDGATHKTTTTLGVRTVPDASDAAVKIGLLGIRRPVVGILDAPVIGVREVGDIISAMGQGLGQVATGRRSVKELGGPVGIARISGQQMELGFNAFAYLIAVVSINLGFINLLPVPMLDGGHLLFYAIEAVRRRPLRAEAQEWAFRGGLAALVALILVVTVNDLGAFGLWKNLAGLIG